MLADISGLGEGITFSRSLTACHHGRVQAADPLELVSQEEALPGSWCRLDAFENCEDGAHDNSRAGKCFYRLKD